MLFLSLLALSADAALAVENSMLPIENGDCSYFCNPVCDFKTTSFKDCKCCFLFFENCDDDRCHNYNPIEKPLEFGKGISKASDAPEDRKSFESKATEVKEMDHDLEEDLDPYVR